jgi:hypothetical protein
LECGDSSPLSFLFADGPLSQKKESGVETPHSKTFFISALASARSIVLVY